MKLLNKLLILLIISVNCALGYQGELRLFIDDDSSSDYKIIASRYDLNSPLFGLNFMMIEGDDYNEVTSDSPLNITGSDFDIWLGFDYVRDQGSHIWPFIGEGIYGFVIKRNDVNVFRFKIDLLHYTGSPDINFEYIHSIQKLTAYADSRREVIYNVQFDDMLYSWLILNEERDITAYENEVEITNLGNGKINPSLNIKLENADMGFPYINYSVGTEFNTSQHINVWRGAFYTLSVVQTLFTRNDTTFGFRHWDNYNVYSNPSTLKILSSTDKIRTIYFPTHPLIITNYLEGGSSTDDFGLSWQQNPDGNYTFDFGESFDAFIYNSNTQDEYSITALPITAQRYNTNWNFLNWDTGSTSTTIQNIKVPDDIPPSGSFTANYKGHFTSAQSDAFTSNGQRKIVLDSQGKYHLVYPSYGKIWSTQSNTTDFNGVWSNEFIFAEESDLQLKNPSIDDFDGYTSATVFEGGMNGFAGIFLAEKYLLNNDSPVITQIPETGIDPNYFGNIKPVVAYTAHEIFVVYKPSSSSPKGIGVNITTAVNG